MRLITRKKMPVARICKTKSCSNEILKGWRVPYCDARRYQIAKKIQDGQKIADVTVLVAGGTMPLLGKDIIIEGAKTIVKR